MSQRQADVAVWGATAAGVLAAVAAADEGRHTVLLDPGSHVGGMLSGGLSRTDTERQRPLIGGMARELFARMGAHYGESVAYHFEPSVAERTLRRWLAEAGVDVLAGRALAGVDMEGPRLAGLRAGEETVSAAAWVDASYEGDLLRAAGVPFAVGREGRDRHGETLAGRMELLPSPHQFRAPVSAVGADGELLPGVTPYERIGDPGHGDGLVQSYCYRLCLTDEPANRLPIDPPSGYDPQRYVLLERYLAALGDAATIRDVLGIGRIPNSKTDVNSGGPVSTNLLGGSFDYPLADAPRRAEIAAEHLSWARGLLYLLRTDASVPQRIRDELAPFGLPRDEFTATGGWPPQLYVRESLRMLGDRVLTEADVLRGRSQRDSIGMGGYNIDIREVQWVAAPVSRFPDVVPEVLVEGYVSVPVQPYAIPYAALLPPRGSCANLLVPVCISASHVAFSSFRMEPQYLIAGQAAGTAAAMAAASEASVHDVDVPALQARLRARGAVLDLADAEGDESAPG